MLKPYFEDMLKYILFGKQDINDVLQYIDLSQYPKSLYKFRSCESEYSFDILENDYLWADSPENFDDPFDSIVYTDREKIFEDLFKCFVSHMHEIIYYCLPEEDKEKHSSEDFNIQQQFVDDTGEISIAKINKYSKTAKKRKAVQEILENLYDEDVNTRCAESIVDSFNDTINHLRKDIYVCCLSQNGDNLKMWEDYADKYRGFVIEYSFDKHDKNFVKKFLYRVFPVQYYKRMPKYDTTAYNEFVFQKHFYNKTIDITDSYCENYKHTLYKKFEYASEEEWRIIVSDKESKRIEFPFVSAVYAGYKITDDNLKRLKEICQKKRIPLYKQALDSIGGRFVYYPVDLSED